MIELPGGRLWSLVGVGEQCYTSGMIADAEQDSMPSGGLVVDIGNSSIKLGL